jgi:hypothetical protein
MGAKRFPDSEPHGFRLGGELEFSQTAEPVTTANARTGPAILDGAIAPGMALSFQRAACAFGRAWLTFDVSRRMKLIVALFSLAILSSGSADTLSPPTVLTVASATGDVLVRVAPSTDEKPPQALVFVYDSKSESYSLRSRFALRNQIRPYLMAVSHEASRIIAIEEYGALGYGPDSVAVYDGAGQLLWRWALSDIFTKDEIARIPSSSSSRWWVETVVIIRQTTGYAAILVPPSESRFEKKPVYHRAWIDLTTGKLTKGRS